MIRMGKSIRRKWVKDTVKDLYLKLIGADNNREKAIDSYVKVVIQITQLICMSIGHYR